MAKYYNKSVGLNDELKVWKDSESKFDKHANPDGADYDLGIDGQFTDFRILIGAFDAQCGLGDATKALKQKGFGVDIEKNLREFINKLTIKKYQVAWIISSLSIQEDLKKDFIAVVMKYHEEGGGLLVWGDNDPYYVHANVVLPELLKEPKFKLLGNNLGSKSMTVGNPRETGKFGPHTLTTGIITLYEGSTICYPNMLGPLKVLGTSTDGQPAVLYADNESLQSETCGRIIVDCGWTKNYCSWHEAGTARYVSNASIWLLGLEHKLAKNETKDGKEEISEVVKSENKNVTKEDTKELGSSKDSTTTTSKVDTTSQVNDNNNNNSKNNNNTINDDNNTRKGKSNKVTIVDQNNNKNTRPRSLSQKFFGYFSKS